MNFVARSTHSNIIINIPIIFMVYVSPLHTFGRTALGTFFRYTFYAPKPIMETTIANIIAFPCVVGHIIREITIHRRFLTRFESSFRPNFKYMFSSLAYCCKLVTFRRTKMAFASFVPRWTDLIFFFTMFTNYYHTNIIGERQENVKL